MSSLLEPDNVSPKQHIPWYANTGMITSTVYLPIILNLTGSVPPTPDTPTATLEPSAIPEPSATPEPTATTEPSLEEPTLLTPAEGSTHTQPTFDWTDITGATSYQFQLSTTENFTNTVVDQIVTDSQFDLPMYLEGEFYWRVYALDGVVKSTAEAVRIVFLFKEPTLLAPTEGSSHGLPIFDWTDVSGDTSYHFQLSTTESFTATVIDETFSASEFELPTYLSGQFYWRVSAVSGIIEGPFSSVWSVMLFEPPTILAPAEGSLQARTTFDWTDVYSATAYQLQLSTTDDFSDLVISQTVTSSDLTFTSVQSGIHYWRVQAQVDDVTDLYSEVWSIQLVDYNGDEDGDSLPNGWELHGYDADDDGTIDVDLPNLDANYLHKDIYVEMDYMERDTATNGLAPNQAVMDGIVNVYKNAPVSNPDGIDGIDVHLELDDLLPYDVSIAWEDGKVSEFYALKQENFDSTRAAVYHYMIWADRYAYHTSEKPYTIGYSRRVPGVDFFVTLGQFNDSNGGTDIQKIRAFIHEFGHNMGLLHGGNNAIDYKTNYFSTMNYWWAITGIPKDGEYLVDYQRFSIPNLKEYNLDETVGLDADDLLAGYSTSYYCPGGAKKTVPATGPIDWNCDGDTDDVGIQVDLDKDGDLKTFRSQNDWENLEFHGGNVIGQ